VTERCSWALALSTLAAAACGADPEDPSGTGAGGIGGGDAPSTSSTGGGGQAPWTSGTAKYAPVWEAQISCTGTVSSRLGDVLAHSGDVFLAGTVDGSCSVFGGDPTVAGSEAVIAARLGGADGATVWARVDVVDGLFGFGAAGLGAGRLVIHGGFDTPFSPEGGPLLEPVTFTDHSPAYTTFLMSVDAEGALASARALSVEQVGAHFDVEPSGTIAIVAGSYQTDFGSGPYPAELGKHPVAQLDAAGTEVWSRVVGADFPALFFAREVAINAGRRTQLTASLLGAMTFGDDALETSTKSSPVVALLDEAGEPIRALAFQASEEGCTLHPLALSDGSFVVSGTCWGTLAIDSTVVGTPATPLAVVIRLSNAGDVAWVRAFEGAIDGMHVAESASGLVLAGRFHDTIDMGDGPLASAGRADILLAGLDPSGATLWSQRMGDEWDNTIEGLAELDGDLIVTSISSLDPDASPTSEGFTLLNVARLRY
jgi:hypothetical protein